MNNGLIIKKGKQIMIFLIDYSIPANDELEWISTRNLGLNS